MTQAHPGPQFDITDIPFSSYGSWFDLSPITAQGVREPDLHLVSHQTGMHAVLTLRPQREGVRTETRVHATPGKLSWIDEQDEQARIELVYETPDRIRVRGQGLELVVSSALPVLTPFSGNYLYHDPVDDTFVFTSYETGRRYRVTALAGSLAAHGVQELGEAERTVVARGYGQPWEIAVEEYEAGRARHLPTSTFAQAADHAATAFRSFTDQIAPWRDARTPAAELAVYILWSATVAPAGFLHRPAVLMSKHWMDKVWSWDHCFNALALAEGRPGLAWDQFRVMFDHQDPVGALPDSVTHSEVLYNFVKPPIHGWALSLLRRRLPAPPPEAELDDIYRRLELWTEYWLEHRRAPGSDLAHYHHGNDSGWDNATTFDRQRVVESADLAAFLVLQMRELAEIAELIGKPDAAARWTEGAKLMLDAMLTRLWDGRRFAARSVPDAVPYPTSSLLDLMPIVLGDLLPEPIQQTLALRIEHHLTEHGLATEATDSPHYDPDGYWRGPIWAPATVLIEDGLRRAGHTTLADEISRRFRTLCENSGFAENFDALTGQGLRDRAYTWTASSYLLLAEASERRGDR